MNIISRLAAAVETGYNGRRSDLAAAAGVDPGTLSRVLRGDVDPHLGTVETLARALGLELTLTRTSPVDDGVAALLAALRSADVALVRAAVERAESAGEPQARARVARLIDRNSAAVTRLLSGESAGFGSGPEADAARLALLQHLANPVGQPLPQPRGGRRPKSTGP